MGTYIYSFGITWHYSSFKRRKTMGTQFKDLVNANIKRVPYLRLYYAQKIMKFSFIKKGYMKKKPFTDS